jgi:hypothetical protein
VNGRFIADGRTVRREPQRTETGFKMGFVLCHLANGMPDAMAEDIATAMNACLDREAYAAQRAKDVEAHLAAKRARRNQTT